MGFHLDAHVVGVVEGDDPGVVLEHRAAEVAFAEALADGPGGTLDVRLVQAVHHLAAARFAVLVVDAGGKYLVLAVFRPSLGQHLDFRVGGVGGQAHGGAVRAHGGVRVVGADGVQLFQAEGQGILAAEGQHGRIVHGGQRDDGHLVTRCPGHLRGLRDKAGLCGPFVAAFQGKALDEFVGQKVAGDVLHVRAGQGRVLGAGHVELGRGVHGDGAAVGTQHQGQGVARGTALVVGDAGAKAHFQHPVRRGRALRGGQQVQRGVLQHGVVQHALRHHAGQRVFRKAIHGEHPDEAHGFHVQAQRGPDLGGDVAAHGIGDLRPKANFYAPKHD